MPQKLAEVMIGAFAMVCWGFGAFIPQGYSFENWKNLYLFIYSVCQLNLLGPSEKYTYTDTSEQIFQVFPLLLHLDNSNRP